MVISEKKVKIKNSQQIASVMTAILQTENEIDRNKEHYWTIGLNNANVIQYIELVSLGDINTCLANPREVFRFAVMKGVANIITAHNHPSGEINPSKFDIDNANRIFKAGEILLIKMLDHILISGIGSYQSFKDDLLLPI